MLGFTNKVRLVMDFFNGLFDGKVDISSIALLSLICAVGLALGKLRIRGVSLGVTCVFFTGIVAGHFGLAVDPTILDFVQNFGLVLFVYALGVQVGPGFFSAFRSNGIRLNALGLLLIAASTAMAVAFSFLPGMSLPEMMGLLSGAVTNTPALAASQQTLAQMGLDSTTPALSCAVTYPLGVVGVILAIAVMRRFFVRPADMAAPQTEHVNNTFIASMVVANPGIFGRDLRRISEYSHVQFVVSRIWHDGHVSVPSPDTIVEKDDRLLVVASRRDIDTLEALIGRREQTDWNRSDVDWNSIDSSVVSRSIVVTRPSINGRSLGSLHLRNSYGINISRIVRSGVILLATPDLVLQLGDRVVVVGEAPAVDKAAAMLGNAVRELNEPHLPAIFVGLLAGLIVGAIPLAMPGMSAPLKLGLAGGPIIVGILIGAFGYRLHIITYSTESVNLMLRALGLSLYLSCLGLSAGPTFFEAALSGRGAMWVALGFAVTLLPTLLVGWYAMRRRKVDFATTCGMLCGAMANPMALTYANEISGGDRPSVAYTTVYPLSMFIRVVLAQVILMIFM